MLNFSKYIVYSDDTTLSSNIHISAGTTHEINNHLSEVYDWLAVNKLSLNVKNTKYRLFHAINNDIAGVISGLGISGIILERVQNFNFPLIFICFGKLILIL